LVLLQSVEILTMFWFVAYAAVVGAVGWTLYTVWVRSRLLGSARRRPAMFAVELFAIPPLVVLAFSLAIWPVLERSVPAVAYRYGTWEVRERIEERVVRAIRVGDRQEDLAAVIPNRFPRDGSVWLQSFAVRLEGGRVVSVERK
jgi:hypothetical protein